ncbi:hypothetical protein [Salinicola halophilus]|uniref:hypothetical protein n=1 Tax=Salinicola halophilus TaxID=184065 RepID=UPI000DA1D3F2|nr:hypothetical protein [Salinicola halophilus]
MSEQAIPERQFLSQVLQQNEPAVSFCEQIFGISQTLDDIVDGDKSITQGAIIHAFWQALIELPANPFYRANEMFLRPLLAQSLQDWTDSTVLERTQDEHDASLAFVLRDQLTGVVVQCAYLIGGAQWMRQVSTAIRRYFHDEKLADYRASLPGVEPEPSEPASPAAQPRSKPTAKKSSTKASAQS